MHYYQLQIMINDSENIKNYANYFNLLYVLQYILKLMN